MDSERATAAARRRRERRLRGALRHQNVAIAIGLATASHHSAQKRPAATHAATQIMPYAVPTLVVEYITPAPGAHSKPAPMNEHVVPALDLASLLELPVPDCASRPGCAGSSYAVNPFWSRHPNFREFGNCSRSPCEFCGDS